MHYFIISLMETYGRSYKERGGPISRILSQKNNTYCLSTYKNVFLQKVAANRVCCVKKI